MYRDDRRPTVSPQLGRRVAVLAGVAVVLFGLILFRLWYLQVLSGDRYVAEANDNRVREVKVQAPRGEVVDREGRTLVANRSALSVRVTPGELPPGAGRRRVIRRLGRVLGMKPARIRRELREQLNVLPFTSPTVKQEVPLSTVSYLLENKEDFPGVKVERVYLRQYPRGQVGAHLFGTVGEVTKEQLAERTRRLRGVSLGDRVGQSGIEYSYDRYLRGRNGATRLQVDAMGSLTKELAARDPEPGRRMRLSVDLDVQRAAQRAFGPGRKGGFVVMDVRSGAVRALGSAPSFDPNVFARRVTQRDYERLSSKTNGEPIVNRATQSVYPTASTFKLITATAGLESGLITPDEVIFDGGSLSVGGQSFSNAGGVSHGPVSLRRALEVSSDVYFYRLGQEANNTGDGLAIQRWARRLGLGRETGIDLPAEGEGRVPTPKLRAQLNRSCGKRYGLPKGVCAGDGRPWSVGDNINLSVGQGDLGATPLQMAVAYSAIANGGYVVRPHLAQRVEDVAGRPVQDLKSPPRRRVKVSAPHRQAILDGLRQAASGPGGTSTDVFKGFPIPIAGKTGTAEKGAGRPDQSWYMALAPYPNPRYVVAVTDEAGGFGAETAAPAARRILAALFEVKGEKKRLVKGESRTN